MKIRNLLLILFVIQFTSCKKEEPSPIETANEEIAYPLTVGNEWSYVRLFSSFNFRPFQPNVIPPRDETIIERSLVTVSRRDTLLDSIQTIVLRDILYEQAGTFIGESYYNKKDSWLYFYAYQGISFASPKVSPKQGLLFKGRNFRSLSEITSFITGGYGSSLLSSDSLIYENPQLRSLPTMYRVGDQWSYRASGQPFKIDKKIVGKEFLPAHRGDYECYKIQWYIDINNDGEWDEDIEFFDWISSKGLIQRSVLYKDLRWTGADDPEPVGMFDGKDEFSLIGLKIQQDSSSSTIVNNTLSN